MQEVAAGSDPRRELMKRFAATGRKHPYLAFTVNSICDRDCTFCKPRCMEDYGPKNRPLQVGEYSAIAAEAGAWGMRKAHLSGGEPTLRPDIVEIVTALRSGLGPDSRIGITTHGNLRRSLTVERLREAGLSYINISIHSLDLDRSSEIMGGGDPRRSLHTLETALALGMAAKVNCVLQRSYLDDAFEVLELARTMPISVRLIELQDIGPARAFFAREFVPECEAVERLAGLLDGAGEVSRAALGVRSPGSYRQPSGWTGNFAFISNSSCASCSDANRIKITPTGVARPCILHNRDIELREHLEDRTLDHAFAHLFAAILERDTNPAWGGFHYVDYDLRWDRMERPKGAVVLPLTPVASGTATGGSTRTAGGSSCTAR